MFGESILKRAWKSPAPSAKPWVERLEDRLCPAGGPPLLHVTLSAVVLANHQVTLSGAVSGGEVAGVEMVFGGSVTGSAITDANGNYSYTTSNATLGQIYAAGEGTEWAFSAISKDYPWFSGLQVTTGAERSVTVTGTLMDLDAAGQSVSFSGVLTGYTVTNAQGYFSYTGIASGLGEIWPEFTDLWGQTGYDMVSVSSNEPFIEDFGAANTFGNIWHFSGRVIDEYAEGMVVYFGGLASLNGRSAVVQADGTFSLSVTLAENEGGTATAVTTDMWGQTSNEAWFYVA